MVITQLSIGPQLIGSCNHVSTNGEDDVLSRDGEERARPKIVCFLTKSVQLTFSSVHLTLLECYVK